MFCGHLSGWTVREEWGAQRRLASRSLLRVPLVVAYILELGISLGGVATNMPICVFVWRGTHREGCTAQGSQDNMSVQDSLMV